MTTIGTSQNPLPWLVAGTWSLSGQGFGVPAKEKPETLLSTLLSIGIRHFDTALFYGKGAACRVLGKAVRQDRTSVTLIAKGGLLWDGNRVRYCASKLSLTEQAKQSLDALQTDYLDAFLLHWPDPNTPLAESVEALLSLKRSGLIRKWGVCNLTISELAQITSLASPDIVQYRLNPLQQEARDRLAFANSAQRLVYSPLAQGMLTASLAAGKYDALSKHDVRRKNPLFANASLIRMLKNLQINLSGSDLALISYLWTLSQDVADGIIVGPRRLAHLESLRRLLGLAEILPIHRWPDRVTTNYGHHSN